MDEELKRAQARFKCVWELSTFFDTSFEDEYKKELAREALCNEFRHWESKGLVSWREACRLESSVMMAAL